MSTHAEPNAATERLLDAARTIERLKEELQRERRRQTEPLAVVGLALRMPGGADTPDRFWQLLADGVDTVTDFPRERGEAKSDPDPDHPGTPYVTRGAFLDGRVDGFDPGVFGISPREAIGMDPQQRIVLELAWEALERAGYAPDSLADSATGVFVGVSTTDYVRMRQERGDPADVDHYQLLGEPAFIAGRVSYTLGLQGPSNVVDTTCSSSLVALDQAARALRDRRCDLALAGGVNLMLSPYGFLLMSKFKALAPDGRCKTFDESADGYVRGEGAGLLVLKRLSDAVAAGDRIRGIVRGSAVNHDGASSGLTVPNGDAQQRVLRAALADAALEPGDVDLVEAHGTGTALGDPIELRALEAVYGAGRPDDRPLLLGSVKTNVGHLEPAAGIAGVAKALLALEHGQVPPHLHLEQASTRVPWGQMHLDVPTRLRPWPETEDGRPPRAAVSSFGASGTNAHVILEAAPRAAAGEAERAANERPETLLLSARTPTALAELARRTAETLRADGAPSLADAAYTTQVGRARLAEGAAVTAEDAQEAAELLDALAADEQADGVVRTARRGPRLQRAAWLLPGQGAQALGMMSGLRDLPAFAEPLREVLSLLDPELDQPLGDTLWRDADPARVDDTAIAQPALFACAYALGTGLRALGVKRPAALLGHSIGELAAACLAGAIDLPDAARLVAARGRLMSALPAGGAMVALGCTEERALAAIPDGADVALAAVNGERDVVLSGRAEEVDAIAAGLEEEGVRAQRLRVSHAFHSPLLKPALDELRAVAASVTVRKPEIPIVSNVTGELWDDACLEPEYWVRHAAGTVRFADGVRTLHAEGIRTFVELGPHPVLTTMARRVAEDEEISWIPTLRRGRDDRAAVQEALGRLDLEGGRVDWQALHAGRDLRRAELPTYPWERERFWFAERAVDRPAGPGVDGLGRRLRSALPTFEEELSAPPSGLPELVERAVRAASAAGVPWSGIGAVTLAPPIGPAAETPWLVHAALHAGRVEIDGAGAAQQAAGAPRHHHATVELRDGDAPAPPSAAAAWGSVLRRAEEAFAGEGPLVGLEFASCDDPDAVAECVVHPRESDEGEVADVELRDADGATVGTVYGLRRADAPAPQIPWYDADSLLLGLRWEAVDGVTSAPLDGPVLLRDAPAALAEELSAALRDRGVEVRTEGEPRDAALVVLFPDADAPTAEELTTADLDGRLLDATLDVTQLVAGLDGEEAGTRVAVVTRGGLPTDVQRAHRPTGAPLHGLGRVLAVEHPNAWGGVVDLDPDDDAGPDDAAAIADALLDLEAEDEQAVRGSRRLAARVVPREPGTLPPRPERLHRPGTVLVTGGLGGIGAVLARWLAATGTEKLVLTARSPLPPEETWPELAPDDPAAARVATVRALRALGAQVEVAAVDVTDAAATTSLIQGLGADDALPLRGVVHAAGVSDPQFARDVEPDRFRAVWAPKVTGAWILHEATKKLDLDLFVCLSSVAATWGSQHLASYSAANAFLDTLAHTRRAQGLPALTVAWGPWALPSGLFDGEVLAFMESIGLRQLAPAQCLDLLGRLQAAGDTEAFVCAADWSTYGPVMEARRPRPRLRELVAAHQQQSTGDAALIAKLESADAEERERLLLDVATTAVADVLQLKPDAIDPDGEVFQLGLDSLMVMEIVGRLRALLGIELRPSELFDRASARAWAAHLATRIGGDETSAAEPTNDWTTPDKIAEDAHLADDVVPVAPAPTEPPVALRDVLLTGATGFVGVFVLAELLAAGAERVRCLVRADSPDHAYERIEANAAQYLELPHDWRERTTVVLGDLGSPGLGVEDLDHLVQQADAVLHVGAGVNFAHPYERLRAPNVTGTEELLRACGKHGTPLHHVSTYGIWGLPTEGRDTIREGDDIATAGRLITGYVQTKWAAEKLVLEAAERGIAVACHRLGRVLGDARTGAALTTHFTLRVIKGCIQLGAAPDMDDLDIEMTPVDYVAKALVHLAKTTAPKQGDVFHLVNQRHMPFATLVDHLRERGWALETLDPHTWYERLESALGNEPNELHPVMDTVRELVVGGERAIVYDDTRAREALEGSGIACPPLDRQLLDTYLDRLVTTEYLPPVPAASV